MKNAVTASVEMQSQILEQLKQINTNQKEMLKKFVETMNLVTANIKTQQETISSIITILNNQQKILISLDTVDE